MKIKLNKNVYEAAQERIAIAFDNFEKICVSFSGGKDSTVMLHMVMEEAIKRNRKVAMLFIDLEGQYTLTIEHIKNCYEKYKENIEPYWFCLPIHLRNAVSVYESVWICWDETKKQAWVREPPEIAITDGKQFPFFHSGMEFEEFDVEFEKWYSEGKPTACFIGIRADESLNRYRTIASKYKETFKDMQFTTKIAENLYNFYPIYDWKTDDIWIYQGKNMDKEHNPLYDMMHKAGLTISQMRICQPYGDDQRRGLWLFHLIEPETWARIVARVNGANSGALYINETGNINGYRRISKPQNHTWKSFALLLLNSMPPKTKEHYTNKITTFIHWWENKGYAIGGIPDEAELYLETHKNVPSWRRICKSLLRNDYWCKGIGFTQHRSEAYIKYLNLMKRRRKLWKTNLESS